MNTSRLVLGIFGVGIAVVFAIDSTGYPDQAAQMPLIYSMAVALLSLGIVVQELVSLRRHRTVAVESSDAHLNDDANDDKSDAPSRYWAVFITFVLAIIYAVIINSAGYLLSTVAFMLAALWVTRTVSIVFSLIGIAAVVAVICIVFIAFLGLPIPLLPTFF
ncbi:tripartite tricarboxylate transporter TctB family protein [Marinobacter sp. M3C]|uniref:tripartite tricarboxylate transporter TctB family protein n=1 Tax=Marinobacter sp. M3C TaxID=2917715 RepID=UPI00200CBC0A|nr:tripartite tricarboxylate transporter TctB family protein [Marinobacter sp. M3C]MCL1477117.1 tripartite tricarboxylate transporter TctB family protein [Marinobacter sp.]UQG62282.1 tripartite tricarboxylate transporter TctB family protein [Marinobacter sp. M3C]